MSDAPEAEPAAVAEPPAEKPRKRRRKAASEAGRTREGVPAFARHFPADPELDRLLAAFEAGNYAWVRDHAPRLAGSATSPAVKRAAEELARRLRPEPTAVVLLVIAALLLATLAGYYWSTPHAH